MTKDSIGGGGFCFNLEAVDSVVTWRWWILLEAVDFIGGDRFRWMLWIPLDAVDSFGGGGFRWRW